MRGDSGQSSVEFAVVSAVLLIVAIGLAAVFDHFSQGSTVEAANANAAYVMGVSANAARYVLMF